MEETEFEEGEACYYKDDTSIDPDIALSYIDEKLQSVLGHLQKDFEGGVSAENLGAKFGGYGSFLPMYQRSPSICSQPKSPPRVQSRRITGSPNNLSKEGAPRSSAIPSDAPPHQRQGNASHVMHSLHNLKVSSGDVSAKQDSCLSSVQVAERFPMKQEPSMSKQINPIDQRTLRLRIKVASDNTARKNEIYSGLGLISPSSSMGNSPEESAGMLFDYQETRNESPASILQIMTSSTLPEGILLSPLQEHLLCLIKTEKLSLDSKPPVLMGRQEHPVISVNDSASKMGDSKVWKTKKTPSVGKSEILEESKNGNGMDLEVDMVSLLKKNTESGTLKSKQSFSKDVKLKSLSNSLCDIGDCGAPMTAEASRVVEKVVPVKKREVKKDWVKDRLPTSDLTNEESLESISGQDGGKYEHRETKNSSVEKIEEHRESSFCKDVSVDHREGGKIKGNIIPASFEFDSEVTKCESGFKGAMNNLKQKVGQKATSHEQDEMKIPYATKKSSYLGKRKSKGSQSSGKSASCFTGSLRGAVSTGRKVKKSAQKDARKVRTSYKDVLDVRLEHMDNQIDPLEKPAGNRAKESNLVAVGDRQAFVDKLKESASCKKPDDQLTSETFLKEASNDGPSTEGRNSETEMATAAPVVIEEDWVCCDHCQTWRLLPYGMKPEQLPDKWLCSMLNWLPGMNHCDISEEETTKALHALYLLPLPESQNSFQSNATRTASGVLSADVRHFNQNNQNLRSDALLNRGKKKYKSKETFNTASNGGLIPTLNFSKNFRPEVETSRSLNDMHQPVSDSNLMNHSNTQNLTNIKQKKKSKMESDQSGYGTTKKIKTVGALDINKYQTSEYVGDFGKVGLSSSIGLPTKEVGKDVQKRSEHSYSKDAKCEPKARRLISVKKQRDHAQVSLDNGPFNMETSDGREMYVKKRKLKDWQESQNCTETLRDNGSHPQDGKMSVKEESSDSEFRKEKKSKLSITEGKKSISTIKVDDILNQEGRMTRILLSSSRGNTVDRSIEKDQQPMKYRVTVARQRSLDDVDSLKRDLGAEQLSMAATSSSSKVSDSRKTRASYQDVRGSPVESVSSSPMRTSTLDKRSPTRMDSSGNVDSKHGVFSLIGTPRKFINGDSNVESNQTRIAKKGKASGFFHPQSSRFPALDFRDADAKHNFGSKSKSTAKPLSGSGNGHVVINDADDLEQRSPCHADMHTSDHFIREDRMSKKHASLPQKSVKGSSSWSKDKYRSPRHKIEGGTGKISDPLSKQEELNRKKSLGDEAHIKPHYLAPRHEELGDAKHNISDELFMKSMKVDKSVGKNGSGKSANDSRRENQPNFGGHDSSDMKLGALCGTDDRVTGQRLLILDIEGEIVKKVESTHVESRSGKSLVNPHYAGKQDSLVRVCQSVHGSLEGSGLDVRPFDASVDVDGSNVLKKPVNAVYQNGAHQNMGHSAPEKCVARDPSAPSHGKRDVFIQPTSSALKEAEDLRDYADHLKNSGFGFECNEAYFQAALKFLHGASLLETCKGESSKHGEMTQVQIYSNAAKLCEICAHEYEKRQEMAAAALAYKCMEVAYMKIVYCKNSITNRDRHELHASSQMVPQGESPLSSESGIDNLNHQATMDKAAFPKAMGSHIGTHVVVPRNRPKFVRLLDFTKDVNYAMEASRKSRNAFAAANVILEEAQNKEYIISVKSVIEFSFQDVDELLRLVRLAIEAINRQGFNGSID